MKIIYDAFKNARMPNDRDVSKIRNLITACKNNKVRYYTTYNICGLDVIFRRGKKKYDVFMDIIGVGSTEITHPTATDIISIIMNYMIDKIHDS